MRRVWLVVLGIVFGLSALPSIYGQGEVVTREAYIKQIVQLLDLGSQLPENPASTDYVAVLNKSGFEINPANLGSPIAEEEKSQLINKVINIKLEKRGTVPEGEPNKAIVDEVSGEVTILKEGRDQWMKAEKDMELGMGDMIKTGVASYIYLRVGRFGRITIKENSELTLKDLSYNPDRDTESIILNLAMGEGVIDSREIKKGSRFEVHTPTTLAAVRGTIYSVKIINGGQRTNVE